MFFIQPKEPNMKFNHLLDQAAELLPAYDPARRDMTKTVYSF